MEYTRELHQILEKNSLFFDLSLNDIHELAKILSLDKFNEGDDIVVEGDNPDKIYVILKGKASVIKTMIENDEKTDHQIAVLNPGESIGDVTIIDRQPRSATVRALEPCETISFGIDQLATLSHHEDSIEAKLKINFALRLSRYLRDSNNNTLSERKKHQSEITQLTNYDVVTGLPNQYLFREKLAEQLAEFPEASAALIQIEIVDYKEICDALGTDIGEQFLTALSERLTSSLSEVQIFARVGFNQFILLYTDYNNQSDVTNVVTRIINQFSNPLMVQNDNIFTNIYVGICFHPDDGIQPEILMKHAGLALDAAKLNEPNSFAFYNSEMDALIAERRKLIHELRDAFDKDQFELYYQPQVSLQDSDKLIGVEALIRWMHPERGMVSPVIFIPIVEQTGMIIQLGYWIFKTACQQAKLWSEIGQPLRIAVNLSSIQFMQKDLFVNFKKIIEEIDVSPALIELEITESVMLGDIEETISKIQDFVSMGFIIALDDFGTGYSSLSYLRKLPIHKIKIDQSFVRDISKNEDAKDIIRCIVGMAKGLRLDTIAEGIEDQEQKNFLKDLNVNEGQGYLFSKPISVAELEAKYF
jgi:diguanylate cyclase (GGDEF)-like protein